MLSKASLRLYLNLSARFSPILQSFQTLTIAHLFSASAKNQGGTVVENKPKKTVRKRRSSKKKPSVDVPDKPRKKLTPARLADKLRRIRLRHSRTQEQMIVIVNPDEHDGKNRARISQYERNLRIPSLIELYNYARFAGIPAEILLSDDFDLPDEYRGL